MDIKEGNSDIGEAGGVMLTKPIPSRATLTLPSRFPADVLFRTSDATPSPMTLVSSFFAEQVPDSESKSFSQLLAGAMAVSTPKSTDCSSNIELSTCSSQSNSVSGLVAKDAEIKGSAGNGYTGVAKSTIARFKTMTPSRLPIPLSPFLTIPPGLSPTTLLDSPVLLSAAQAEPSPTTGSFALPPFVHGSETSRDKYPGHDESASFVFKPFPKLGKNPSSPLADMGPFGFSHQQVLAEVQAQAQKSSFVPPSTVTTSTTVPVPTGPLVSSVNVAKLTSPLQCLGIMGPMPQPVSESLEKVQPLKVTASPPVVERPSEDGYNWRKYGQKQVKGSEYPRSYYKCTFPNCPVKKKVERAHDGQVTEIVYKGEHNHAKPQATRRMSAGTVHLSDGGGRTSGKAEGPNAVLMSAGSDQAHPPDLKSERMELNSDPSALSKGRFLAGVSGTPETSSGSTSDEGEDCSKAEDGDNDEPDSKRRKEETDGDAAAIVPLRTIREPRVVVQTTSDIDILDDGYRWRKYGQKVVKGNPHPRSYYKCTNLGCSVRKHVERSSTDPRAVITTYEGKHNHDVPAARNSSVNNNNNNGSAGSAVNSVSLPALAQTGLGVNSVTKPCTSVQDQIYLGKLQEDSLNATDKMPMGLDLVSNGGVVNGGLASDHWNRVHGNWEIPSKASMSLMSSGFTGSFPYASSASFGQSLMPRAEEHGDGYTLDNSLQEAFHPGSLCQEMPQRLVLGP